MEWSEIYCRLRCEADDRLAWSALEERVRRIAQRALGRHGPAVVDDATADTCSSVVMGLDRARGPETFAGFVYGHFLNVRRRYLLRLPTTSTDDPTIVLATTEIADDPRLDVLQGCLTCLPERERRAVELRYFHDCRADEIAGALGVTTVNARRILFNALTHLRQCMSSSQLAGTAPEATSLGGRRAR